MRLLFLAALLSTLGSNGGWTPMSSGRPEVILEGNWQSCLEDDGDYTERIYEYRPSPSMPPSWELHMGPHDEFALFRSTPEHLAHDSAENLLGPGFHIHDIQTNRGKRNWSALNLWISIVMAGGSRDDCQSFYVLVTRQTPVPKDARRR